MGLPSGSPVLDPREGRHKDRFFAIIGAGSRRVSLFAELKEEFNLNCHYIYGFVAEREECGFDSAMITKTTSMKRERDWGRVET
jgi:hypothetical protein